MSLIVFLFRLLLAALSGALIAVSYLYQEAYLAMWVAFVPLLLAIRGQPLLRIYLLGLTAGAVWFVLATPWMATFITTLKDFEPGRANMLAAVYWLYSAQIMACLAVLVAVVSRWTGVGIHWMFPLVAMAVFAFFPQLFPLQLGESQSAFLPALQGASLAGVYGLDFMIALSNGVLASVLMSAWRTDGVAPSRLVLPCLLLGAWFGYGFLSLGHWQSQTQEWPVATLGLVQPNEGPSASVPMPVAGYSRAYPPELEMTERLAEGALDLVIWPETRFKGYFRHPHVAEAYRRTVATTGVPLLFHDAEVVRWSAGEREYNSAVLLDEQGLMGGVYRKNRLVAFGEHLPLPEGVPLVSDLAQRALGDFLTQLTPGVGSTSFQVGRLGVVPVICYESAFPGLVARAVHRAETPSIITVMSNNGWFGDSVQPYQHIGATVLRAVENRLPVVHVMNNGPSTLVLPSGQVKWLSSLGEAAGLVVNVPYPQAAPPTLFNRMPSAVPLLAVLLICFLSLLRLFSDTGRGGDI